MPVRDESENRLLRLYKAAKLGLSTNPRWVVLLLVITILWPWIDRFLWYEVAAGFVDWLGSNRGWGRTWRALFLIGLVLWLFPIAISGWAVLRLREEGIVYPILIYALLWAEIAFLVGFTVAGVIALAP